MILQKMSSVETDWYTTQDGSAQAKDLIFKDFCDYIICIKTFADVNDNSQLKNTSIIHINSNNGGMRNMNYDELDPPFKEILEKSNFPIVK